MSNRTDYALNLVSSSLRHQLGVDSERASLIASNMTDVDFELHYYSLFDEKGPKPENPFKSGSKRRSRVPDPIPTPKPKKRPVGRPRGSTADSTMKLYSFNCPPELMEQVSAIARSEMTSSAAVIRRALKRYLDHSQGEK